MRTVDENRHDQISALSCLILLPASGSDMEPTVAVFTKYAQGPVDARVMLDKMTGRSRGFGFVTFDTKEDMEECIAKLDKTELEGRRISVTRAIPQTEIAPGAPAHSLNGPGRRDKYWPRHPVFSPLSSHHASHLYYLVCCLCKPIACHPLGPTSCCDCYACP